MGIEERGKILKKLSEGIEAKALSRGKTTQEKSDALLAKITPTADPADFAGVDFVIEAVFESQELKHKVFQEIEDIVDRVRARMPRVSCVFRQASFGSTLEYAGSSRTSSKVRAS